MSAPTADAVMAATYKLVQQAMTGRWQDMPKTVEERRSLLDQLSARATAQDQQWLGALKQAMAESDAAVAKMREANEPSESFTNVSSTAPTSSLPRGARETTGEIDGVLEMIRRGNG